MLTLVTYAGGKPCWNRAAQRLETQALRSNLVAGFDLWSPARVSSETSAIFLQAQRLQRMFTKGDGLWSWKIAVLWKAFSNLEPGETLLYLDAGSTLNTSTAASRRRLVDYLSMAREHGQLFFSQPSNPELAWTKNSLRKFNNSEIVWSTPQLLGGILFLNKQPATQRILNRAVEIALDADGSSFLDPVESDLQSPSFIEHRHDQSIISIAAKVEEGFYIPDETYFAPNWRVEGASYPIWATRLCSGWDLTGASLPHRAWRELERRLPF